jgi:DNA end-binding protein Ku
MNPPLIDRPILAPALRTKSKRRTLVPVVEPAFHSFVESAPLSVWSIPVAPRAYWKGYLKLSLVSCPISLFPATSEREKISFHQLNKETGNRIRYRKIDAETGDEVEQADIIKGFEVTKGEYIELDPEELEAVAIESKRTIEIDEFVPKAEIDEIYMRDPYYIVPDGEVGQQAFAVIREAIRKEGMVALGKVVFTSREHVIALEARGNGLMGITLRYPYEVRNQDEYFDVIEDEKVPKDMLELAMHIVDTKRGKFEPLKFEDEYEDALQDLLKKKQKGEKIERPKEPARSNVINLMDALRQSVKSQPASRERGKPGKPSTRAHKKGRSSARQKKAS